MDPDPERNVGHTGLSGESDFHPAAPVIVATPAVAHPGVGPSSAMVTRSRARGGRETNVDPEVEFRPEREFLPETEIPAQTDEGASGATRHLPDIASQYIPETAITQVVTTSITTSTLPSINPRQQASTPHRRTTTMSSRASVVDLAFNTNDSQHVLYLLSDSDRYTVSRVCCIL